MDDTQIKEAYHNLPDLVREIIDGSEWEQSIRNITNKYKLLINQGLVLEDEVLLVMLGLSDPKDFTQKISSDADIDPQVAKEIGKEIEEEVFVKIRHALQDQTGDSADDDFIIEDALKDDEMDVSEYTAEKHNLIVPTPLPDTEEPVFDKSILLEINANIPEDASVEIPIKIQEKPPVSSSENIIIPKAPITTGTIITPSKFKTDTEANFISRKLSETTIADTVDTDHSLQKPVRAEGEVKPQYSAGIDPYREPVE